MHGSSIRYFVLRALLSLAGLAAIAAQTAQAASSVGIFESHDDIGTVLHPGSATYDRAANAYTVSSSGENMWFSSDDFHYVWTKASGDISIAADISLIGHTGAPHRKAMLMIRQTLDPDSPYVDIAQHGVGKTSLQFRDAVGAVTHTIASYTYAPRRIELRKRGDYYYFFVSDKNGRLKFAGASTRLRLSDPFYVGLGVCAHDRDAIEKAIFSRVKLTESSPAVKPRGTLYSTLQTVFVGSGDRQVEYVAPGRVAAPNWSRDGLFVVFSKDGGLFRIPVKCGAEDTGCAPEMEPVRIATDFAARIDDNHGISPNGQSLAISDQSQGSHASSVYVLPIVGGFPRKVTAGGDFFWHGWSPDGKTLALSGEQDGKMNIYTSSIATGGLTQLTSSAGTSDSPEYSPDGMYIYFSSDRSGAMQIWRMRPDGSAPQQVTSDSNDDRFPHVSPDGKWIAYLSYEKHATDDPALNNVTLCLMSLKDRKVRALATLLGGDGTIDAPSWSPDSSKIAFVSYALLPSDKPATTR